MTVNRSGMWQRLAIPAENRSKDLADTTTTGVSSYAHYMRQRYSQLIDGNFVWWVFRYDCDGCEERFADLDGVALEPSHAFWRSYFPPHGPGCGCYVIGARSEAGIDRVGGGREKSLPSWVLDSL